MRLNCMEHAFQIPINLSLDIIIIVNLLHFGYAIWVLEPHGIAFLKWRG